MSLTGDVRRRNAYDAAAVPRKRREPHAEERLLAVPNALYVDVGAKRLVTKGRKQEGGEEQKKSSATAFFAILVGRFFIGQDRRAAQQQPGRKHAKQPSKRKQAFLPPPPPKATYRWGEVVHRIGQELRLESRGVSLKEVKVISRRRRAREPAAGGRAKSRVPKGQQEGAPAPVRKRFLHFFSGAQGGGMRRASRRAAGCVCLVFRSALIEDDAVVCQSEFPGGQLCRKRGRLLLLLGPARADAAYRGSTQKRPGGWIHKSSACP